MSQRLRINSYESNVHKSAEYKQRQISNGQAWKVNDERLRIKGFELHVKNQLLRISGNAAMSKDHMLRIKGQDLNVQSKCYESKNKKRISRSKVQDSNDRDFRVRPLRGASSTPPRPGVSCFFNKMECPQQGSYHKVHIHLF